MKGNKMQHYPYCVHGKYVGGCGADYMCGECEMGEEPTAEQIAEHEKAIKEYSQLSKDEKFWSLPQHVLDGP
jgi:hypothetical protein